MKETVLTGKDRNLEIRKTDLDFPLTDTDQSKICSTHNIVPNKRLLEKKDIKRFIRRLKGNKKEEVEEKKRGRPKKVEKENKIKKE